MTTTTITTVTTTAAATTTTSYNFIFRALMLLVWCHEWHPTNKSLLHQSGSRPVGRPYTSWMATLKSDLSLHNLTFEDAIELALDKSLWRLLVASGATH